MDQRMLQMAGCALQRALDHPLLELLGLFSAKPLIRNHQLLVTLLAQDITLSSLTSLSLELLRVGKEVPIIWS
jgi:hypothetical protein